MNCLECNKELFGHGNKKRCFECKTIFELERKRIYSRKIYSEKREQKLKIQLYRSCKTCETKIDKHTRNVYCFFCASDRKKERESVEKKNRRKNFTDEEKTEIRLKRRKRRAYLKSNGLCTECAQPITNFVKCDGCLVKERSRLKKYRRQKGVKPLGQSGAEDYVFNLLANLVNRELVFRRHRSLIKNLVTNCFLELDFWIPSINFAIEVDGPIHRIKGLYGDERYFYQREKDLIKDAFCLENDIYLLRLDTSQPYWLDEKQLQKILSQAIRRVSK